MNNNFGDTIMIKGTIVGMRLNLENLMEYEIEVPDKSYSGHERITLDENQLREMNKN